MVRNSLILVLLLLSTPFAAVEGQDVEMLGRRYGTPLPDGYERTRGADPSAFTFQRGLRGGRALDIRSFDGGSGGGPALSLGPRSEPVTGTYTIPVLLGLYGNSTGAPYTRSTVQSAYFDQGAGTITDYYDEVSSGLVTLGGAVQPWVRTSRPDTAYTVGESGLVAGSLGGGGAGNFVYELLELQSGVDWGLYDNDGPDGIPNSGDDDGYVDVLAVLHPTRGAECGGSDAEDRIWSHRWSLAAAVGTVFVTSTPSRNGGYIRVDDYTIQPTLACSGGDLNEIGVFTHELGHAFGLPDLYDTCSDARCPEDGARTSGVGAWDLMASGSWGCDNASPDTPCHMGAWTKAALGWVDVVELPADTDHGTLVVPPVETSATVYRLNANDGSGEYFLLENRRRVGYDANLFREGLLVWQVDPDWVLDRWASNRVNANEHLGVRLRQADGTDDLGRGIGRGDTGDPYPGATGNTAFHAASQPAALSRSGSVTGVTLFDIAEGATDVTLRASTRFTTVTLQAEGVGSSDGIFTVDGAAADPPDTTFSSAPFLARTVTAAAGEDVGPGERRPFLEWGDDPTASRSRTVVTPVADTGFVARYGGLEYRLALTTTGGVRSVEPGTFQSDPPSGDLWFDEGTSVTLQAVPRTGFAFLGWSGDLAGQPNPALFDMVSPRSATADFEMIYGIVEAVVEAPAARPLDIRLQVENGVAPVRWRILSGILPMGTRLSADGVISGSALMTGRFDVTVEATDAQGLPASAVLSLDLVDPGFSLEQLASPFLLSGPELTIDEISFLNQEGNRVAPYDIGDFRARVLEDPELPLSLDVGEAVYRRTVVIAGDGGRAEVRDGGGAEDPDGGGAP